MDLLFNLQFPTNIWIYSGIFCPKAHLRKVSWALITSLLWKLNHTAVSLTVTLFQVSRLSLSREVSSLHCSTAADRIGFCLLRTCTDQWTEWTQELRRFPSLTKSSGEYKNSMTHQGFGEASSHWQDENDQSTTHCDAKKIMNLLIETTAGRWERMPKCAWSDHSSLVPFF